jgi:hypothetical protein
MATSHHWADSIIEHMFLSRTGNLLGVRHFC